MDKSSNTNKLTAIEETSLKEKAIDLWKKAKPSLKAIGVGAIAVVSAIATVVVIFSQTSEKRVETIGNDNDDGEDQNRENGDYNCNNDTERLADSEHKMPRYKVEFKAFKTGEWYPKTTTDRYASACSVAKIGNYGRACRLTDTYTGEILYETEEDAGLKETNGYPNGYPW